MRKIVILTIRTIKHIPLGNLESPKNWHTESIICDNKLVTLPSKRADSLPTELKILTQP